MAGPSDTAAEIIEGEDISKAFARIEDELLESMMRNMERHQVEEASSGIEWDQWQAAQIAELERYARDNGLRYGPEFDRLNSKMEDAIARAYESGRGEAEARMLQAAAQGADIERQQGFLRVPRERMDALIRATHDDMMRAEHATLRKASDIYRRTIFDAQVYATSGAGTYAKAIDMAAHDFIAKGVNGIRYRNGSWHGIEEYSRMAVRTATKRAALVAEGDARKDWGVHTIFVNYRADACPECMQWIGRVLIDDVYGGGTAEESKSTGYPLLSDAMAQGLFHPNCRDTSSTYFEGISDLPERPTAAEKARGEAREAEEQRLDQAEDNAERYRRLERFSLDMEDKREAAAMADRWQGTADEMRVQQAAADAIGDDLATKLEDYVGGGWQLDDILTEADMAAIEKAEKPYSDDAYRWEPSYFTARGLQGAAAGDTFQFGGGYRSFSSTAEGMLNIMGMFEENMGPEELEADYTLFVVRGDKTAFDMAPYTNYGPEEAEVLMKGEFRYLRTVRKRINGLDISVIEVEKV